MRLLRSGELASHLLPGNVICPLCYRIPAMSNRQLVSINYNASLLYFNDQEGGCVQK